jgi:hypothetical protein
MRLQNFSGTSESPGESVVPASHFVKASTLQILDARIDKVLAAREQ